MKKKVLVWVGIGFAVFFILTSPTEAATLVKTIVGWVIDAFQGFADFFSYLFD